MEDNDKINQLEIDAKVDFSRSEEAHERYTILLKSPLEADREVAPSVGVRALYYQGQGSIKYQEANALKQDKIIRMLTGIKGAQI